MRGEVEVRRKLTGNAHIVAEVIISLINLRISSAILCNLIWLSPFLMMEFMFLWVVNRKYITFPLDDYNKLV